MSEIDWKARAEAAEAERDEALTALGEHVIATERDRDKYLALQRVIVERDNENEALRAQFAKCAETHAISELLKSDALMVLTVYDAHVLPENRGEWRDRLLAWASPAALVEPVGEPPRPLEHTPSPREAAAMEELVRESERLGLYRENYLTWDALRADVERLNVIPVEDCPSLDAVIVMMRERREHGHERALVPVHCYCWYERDEPCCHCGQTGPNLVVLSSAPPDPESETP